MPTQIKRILPAENPKPKLIRLEMTNRMALLTCSGHPKESYLHRSHHQHYPITGLDDGLHTNWPTMAGNSRLSIIAPRITRCVSNRVVWHPKSNGNSGGASIRGNSGNGQGNFRWNNGNGKKIEPGMVET